MAAYHLPPQLHINDMGIMEIRGIPLSDLAKQFGTPLYVMDEELIRQRCREYKAGFSEYAAQAQVVYAGKALLTMGICRIMDEERLFLDVVSGGELFTTLQAGFPAENIIFHGNNKSLEELNMAVNFNVGRVVIDNLDEMHKLERIALQHKKQVQVMLRITPGVEAHTHEYIRTAQTDSKFGVGILDYHLQEAVRHLQQSSALHLSGIHCHIGSQIMEEEPFSLAVDLMMGFMNQVRQQYGLTMTELNMGGGIGIRYTTEDRPLEPTEVVRHIAEQVSLCANRYLFPLPKLYLEPGRAIVGEAGITLYQVGALKEVPGIRSYLPVDGGMSDNPRPSLYQAVYEAMATDKANQEATLVVHLAGKHCETGDILIKDLHIPNLDSGDYLAVFSTGAYNYSMASNYNRAPKAAMVLVNAQGCHLLQERESYEDLIRLDRIPPHLQKDK
jgi:diaminopimelate decarboxylase